MTVADVIRNMSDMQLAEFLEMIISERDEVISESLSEQGVSHSLISMPALSVLHHLRFLQRPAEDVFNIEEET